MYDVLNHVCYCMFVCHIVLNVSNDYVIMLVTRAPSPMRPRSQWVLPILNKCQIRKLNTK